MNYKYVLGILILLSAAAWWILHEDPEAEIGDAHVELTRLMSKTEGEASSTTIFMAAETSFSICAAHCALVIARTSEAASANTVVGIPASTRVEATRPWRRCDHQFSRTFASLNSAKSHSPSTFRIRLITSRVSPASSSTSNLLRPTSTAVKLTMASSAAGNSITIS